MQRLQESRSDSSCDCCRACIRATGVGGVGGDRIPATRQSAAPPSMPKIRLRGERRDQARPADRAGGEGRARWWHPGTRRAPKSSRHAQSPVATADGLFSSYPPRNPAARKRPAGGGRGGGGRGRGAREKPAHPPAASRGWGGAQQPSGGEGAAAAAGGAARAKNQPTPVASPRGGSAMRRVAQYDHEEHATRGAGLIPVLVNTKTELLRGSEKCVGGTGVQQVHSFYCNVSLRHRSSAL